MDADNPFDRKIEAQADRTPRPLHDAMVFTVDTLDFARAGAETIFGPNPTAEQVFGVYDRMLQALARSGELPGIRNE